MSETGDHADEELESRQVTDQLLKLRPLLMLLHLLAPEGCLALHSGHSM